MRNTILHLLIVLILLSKQELVAQIDSLPPYPSAKEVHPSVIASLSRKNTEFIFGYHVANGSKAVQDIWRFFVEVKSKTFTGTAPIDWHSSMLKRESITAVTWSSEDSSADIRPGKRLTGFMIHSTGIPAIVRFYARGYVDPPEGEFEYQQGSNDVLMNSVQGLTIGPSDPPTPFAPLAFLDTLISYKHQAFDLGWIKNRGIVQSLDAKLENAKRQLQRNNKTAARNMLQAFINEVEALWKEENQRRNPQGVQITSEAYALLKFNAEYLISKL